MNIELYFKNINNSPECNVTANGTSLYAGPVREKISINSTTLGEIFLQIAFTNKQPTDTVVDSSGTIVSDKNFELDKIIIDNYNIEELIWNSEYVADHGDVYSSCLFFGPPGKFTIKLENPVLPWILRTRHERNGDDPNWQEDYNYYDTACKLLAQI